ncbi:hypothetical protein Q4506_02445 [Colwellia sp. 4_MG-2023]|jgi:hypothetical protein|uniref:hypothetical protein n=1 Tax=unclassified Colwellia TaxID=196834 RepID=UPI001C0893DE|nr:MULTISPECIES: hypothetical protein [unclassified Colwellia]MBU2923639.1 hypothetical protein [Colwellia sp. C2M11]MDO6486206.1 hypothetical protein [Colwellia sp. 6_MG-2023]MDO6505838.1 hypothetical protein [Colwellia sp. 5_MG-2023]MDO6554519.1 hypothetical protein [Colwellia sp. 4_MG-2023]MDO6652261.1 hypothetical protein [Colwellia sp. 3_MG-2023]
MISKKVRELFSSLMEAGDGSPVSYDIETEQYTGYFNESVVNKFVDEGVVELVHNDDGLVCLRLINREDFLSGFASGVNEARLGRDQYYADYNASPFAFSIGYEHFLYMNKKPKLLIGYICHGFINETTGEVHNQ